MKNILITVPYPLSVNKIYHNRWIKGGLDNPNRLRGRGLSKEAKDYKMLVASLMRYTFPSIRFGDANVRVKILDNPSNLRGDSHNGLKILFDCIELSGLINNDKQIVAYEVIPGVLKTPPSWTVKIEEYPLERTDVLL